MDRYEPMQDNLGGTFLAEDKDGLVVKWEDVEQLQKENERLTKALRWCHNHGDFDKMKPKRKADWSFEMWLDGILTLGEVKE